MFSIWIGSKPEAKELRCMTANNSRHGLTLLASENWIDTEKFKPLAPIIKSALEDSRIKSLWDAFTEPAYRSDALRIWYLINNPWEFYADSDCVIHSIPPVSEMPLCPSIQTYINNVAKSFGGFPDMDEIKNASGRWLDVWAIVGAGDASFFDAWLTLWANNFFRPGGISEALSHGPFNVGVLPEKCYSHLSTKRQVFRQSKDPSHGKQV